MQDVLGINRFLRLGVTLKWTGEEIVGLIGSVIVEQSKKKFNIAFLTVKKYLNSREKNNGQNFFESYFKNLTVKKYLKFTLHLKNLTIKKYLNLKKIENFEFMVRKYLKF